MTTKQSNYSVDQDLNKKIAINIFNLDIEPSSEQLQAWEQKSKDYSAAWEIYGSELGAAPSRPKGLEYNKMRDYTGNISDAFLVVEKMRENGWWLNMRKMELWFERNGEDGPAIERSENQSFGEMICKAALGAIGIMKPKSQLSFSDEIVKMFWIDGIYCIVLWYDESDGYVRASHAHKLNDGDWKWFAEWDIYDLNSEELCAEAAAEIVKSVVQDNDVDNVYAISCVAQRIEDLLETLDNNNLPT